MKHKIIKTLSLFIVSCGSNDHFRSRSDYHFWVSDVPEVKIKLNKVGDYGIQIQQVEEINNSEEGTNFTYDTKSWILNLKLDSDRENTNPQKTNFQKKIILTDDQGKKFFIKVDYKKQFQLINYDVGIGKIYHINNITTDIPDADIKGNVKNKLLYTTYKNENEVVIEY